MAPARTFYGWRVVAACFVIAAFAWALGLFGSSVYLQAVTSERGWTVAEVASAITVFFLTSAAVQRLVGQSIDRLGPRPVLLAGAVSMGLGVALIGQATAPWQLYPCFVLIGLGWSTLSTTGLSATVAPWFERHQGRSMTLAIMGASVGAIAGVPLIVAALSRFGLAQGLIVVGAVAVACLLPLIAVVLRFRGPSDLGLGRDGDIIAGASPATPGAGPIAERGRPGILLWTAAAGFALALLVQIAFITHHVAIAAPSLGTHGAGLLVAAAGGTAFVGRMILAAIIDRVDPRRLAIGVMLVQTAALVAMALWQTLPVLICASLVYGYGIGHITTLGPIVVRREFGAANFGRTYGKAATAIQLTSALGPALLGFIRDASGGYALGLGLASGVTVLAALSLLAGARLGAQKSS